MKGHEWFNEMKIELKFYINRISNLCGQYGAKNKVAPPPTAMVHAFTKSGMENSYLFNIRYKKEMNTYNLVYDILCMSWDFGAFLNF